MIWAIKHDAIGNVFFDKAAAKFLLPNLDEDLATSSHPRKADTVVFKRKKYMVEREGREIEHGMISKVSNLFLAFEFCFG